MRAVPICNAHLSNLSLQVQALPSINDSTEQQDGIQTVALEVLGLRKVSRMRGHGSWVHGGNMTGRSGRRKRDAIGFVW